MYDLIFNVNIVIKKILTNMQNNVKTVIVILLQIKIIYENK